MDVTLQKGIVLDKLREDVKKKHSRRQLSNQRHFWKACNVHIRYYFATTG